MMATELACLFPKGLKHKEAERQTQRHPFPFHFVSDKIKQEEGGGDTLHKTIMVKLAPKSTMKVVPHTFSNVRNFLLHKGNNDYILNKHEAKPKSTTLSLMLDDTEVKVKVAAASPLIVKMHPTNKKKHWRIWRN